MRPCGVIVLLTELFISESKSQVYGCMHNYLAHYPTAAKQLGKHTRVGTVIHVASCPGTRL